jgi:hypothetical protein
MAASSARSTRLSELLLNYPQARSWLALIFTSPPAASNSSHYQPATPCL